MVIFAEEGDSEEDDLGDRDPEEDDLGDRDSEEEESVEVEGLILKL